MFSKAEIQQEFARYGFVDCPLTDRQIKVLQEMGFSLTDAYDVGCDVQCGFLFNEALEG